MSLLLKDFRFSQQIGARMNPDEVSFFNEHLAELLPEPDGRNIDFEKEITMRQILLHWINIILGKVELTKKSLPADVEKILVLETELESYKAIQIENGKNAEKLQAEIDRLTELCSNQATKLQELDKRNIFLNGENIRLQAKVQTLENAGSETENQLKQFTENPTTIVINLDENQLVVAESYRIALSEYVKKDVTKGEMFFDLFWKYVSEQNTEIAFPFFFSKRELRSFLEGKITSNLLANLHSRREIKEALQ